MSIDFKWLEEKIFLRTLADQERKTLQNAITVEHFNKGDVVIMQNKAGGTLYLLKSGRVDVILGVDGKSIKLAHQGEGAQLGDMSFVDDVNTSASIIAKESCQVYKITRDALSQLFVYHQSVAKDLTFSIMRNMGRNLRHISNENASSLQYIQGKYR